MSEKSQEQPMEMVIATTSAEHAQRMQEHYVGHTMSGEALERRPMVQLAGAADFLDAAMRLYRITHIRLVPSSHHPALTDVIAEYERAILLCEVCGTAAGYSDLHDVAPPARVEEYHCFCFECKASLQHKLTAEIQEERQRLGDPIDACVEFLLQQKRPVLPHRLTRLLTGKELHEVGRRVWMRARKNFLAVLVRQLEAAGVTDLDAVPLAPHVPLPPPRWEQGKEHLEYRQGERLLGYLVRQEHDDDISRWKKGDWHCLVLPLWVSRSHPEKAPGTWTLLLETRRKLKDARQEVENFWRREERDEAERREIRDAGGYSFQHCGYAFALERDPEWFIRQHLEQTAHRMRSQSEPITASNVSAHYHPQQESEVH